MMEYASIMYKEGEMKKAFKFWERAANARVADGMYQLGVAYFSGIGVKQSYLNAFKCFQKSPKQIRSTQWSA